LDSTFSTGETALWRSVIVYALHDAMLGRISLSGHALRRSEDWEPSIDLQRNCDWARRWLTSRGWDFTLVCHLANLDPSAVRSAAVRAIAESTDQPLIREAQSRQRKDVIFDGARRSSTSNGNFNH
jgi:hypothetical protein